MSIEHILLSIVLAPLIGSLVAGLFGRQIGRTGSHSVTILSVGVSCGLSVYLLYQFVVGSLSSLNITVYQWLFSDGISFQIGFLIDSLTLLMMSVVTFVSLMVHIYTIGYMHDDSGYQRFFSYISLFTFAMLMLVMSNNFMQLFFGWEAVGVVSYLLIGFWFKRESAIKANLKAFLVNRVGDFGFLLGIAAVLMVFNSLDYATVFSSVAQHSDDSFTVIGSTQWSAITVICICLFIGAMGKSAQAPLHVWLPDSMEGPTPISALIHAATMVTAGIFMVARMSPLFEYSETALSFVLIIGSITALFTGLIGIVQSDIKRVIAYSTLSQLGYMTVALGVSAYSAAIFHLMTHAFFKALLFLGAGSVIIALHHQQDMWKMGGLKKYMPITFITAWVGTLALVGFPGTSGFYSKDAIIEVVHLSDRFGSSFAYFAVMAGVVITSLYSFRLLYLTFHGETRMDKHTAEHAKESPWVVTIPLILLAIPSLFIGYFTIQPLLFDGFFNDAVFVLKENNHLAELAHEFHGALNFALHGFTAWPFWLLVTGFSIATYVYWIKPETASTLKKRFSKLHRILENAYGVDALYKRLFAEGSVNLGRLLWRYSDKALIDDTLVNGSAKLVAKCSLWLRQIQTGYVYHYAFAMVLGLIAILGLSLNF